MTPEDVGAGLLAAGGFLAARGSATGAARRRLRRLTRPPRTDGPAPSSAGSGLVGRRLVGWHRPSVPVSLVVAGVVLTAVVGGATWAGTALVLAVGIAWLGARRDAAAARRRDAAVAAALPHAADLLAACLAAGASPVDAVGGVAEAFDGPLADRMRGTARAMRLGADPAQAWGPLRADDPVAALSRAFTRAAASGAPLAQTVGLVAEEQRRRQRWAAEAAARRAGVLAVGPLVSCFLPAFVLVGVVPLILGVARQVLDGLR
jgi:pilus assembly protein TadC